MDNIYQSCIKACLEAAAYCENCASSCLAENDMELIRCINLNRDCADFCLVTVQFMMRSAEYAAVLCGICAEICEACAAECHKHDHMKHCHDCAEACKICADECRKMLT